MPYGLVHYKTADYRNPRKCSELFERIVFCLLESGIPQLNIGAQTAVHNHLLNNLCECPFLGTGEKPIVGMTTVRTACRRHSVLTFSLRIKDLFRIGPFRAVVCHSHPLPSSIPTPHPIKSSPKSRGNETAHPPKADEPFIHFSYLAKYGLPLVHGNPNPCIKRIRYFLEKIKTRIVCSGFESCDSRLLRSNTPC